MLWILIQCDAEREIQIVLTWNGSLVTGKLQHADSTMFMWCFTGISPTYCWLGLSSSSSSSCMRLWTRCSIAATSWPLRRKHRETHDQLQLFRFSKNNFKLWPEFPQFIQNMSTQTAHPLLLNTPTQVTRLTYCSLRLELTRDPFSPHWLWCQKCHEENIKLKHLNCFISICDSTNTYCIMICSAKSANYVHT